MRNWPRAARPKAVSGNTLTTRLLNVRNDCHRLYGARKARVGGAKRDIRLYWVFPEFTDTRQEQSVKASSETGVPSQIFQSKNTTLINRPGFSFSKSFLNKTIVC